MKKRGEKMKIYSIKTTLPFSKLAYTGLIFIKSENSLFAFSVKENNTLYTLMLNWQLMS